MIGASGHEPTGYGRYQSCSSEPLHVQLGPGPRAATGPRCWRRSAPFSVSKASLGPHRSSAVSSGVTRRKADATAENQTQNDQRSRRPHHGVVKVRILTPGPKWGRLLPQQFAPMILERTARGLSSPAEVGEGFTAGETVPSRSLVADLNTRAYLERHRAPLQSVR
jgi:hypothetical protein